jgi:hypothetical protein
METIAKLHTLLTPITAGKLSKDIESRVVDLLSRCWDQFEGSHDTKMTPEKVMRAGDIEWNPPHLSFNIPRHGAVVLGSKREELHRWSVDIDRKTAQWISNGYRNLVPNARSLDVKAIAASVCEAIRVGAEGTHDLHSTDAIVWDGHDVVTVRQGILIPNNAVAQTIAGRRRRFRNYLTQGMKALGWDLIKITPALKFKRGVQQQPETR